MTPDAKLFLSQAEIDDLCHPLTQPSAQVRFLRASGLTVTVKPNGRPAVVRSHAESVLSGQSLGQSQVPSNSAAKPEADRQQPRPNVEGFMQLIQGGRRGKKTAVQSA